MKRFNEAIIALFGCIEVIFGLVTIIALLEAKLFFGIAKPPPAAAFVLLTAIISFSLGCGILLRKLWARKLLMFFAGYIILTKVFILLGVLILSPPFLPLVSSNTRAGISVFYHLLIILFFNKEDVRAYFLGAARA